MLLVAFCVGVLAFRGLEPFLGSPVNFACLHTCQRDPGIGVGWGLLPVARTVEAPGWAILYSALLACAGLFGFSGRIPPRLAWLPVFKGPPVRGEGQDLSNGCVGTSFPCLQSGFPTLCCYWRPQGRDSRSLFQSGGSHCLRPRGLTGKTKQKMVFFDSVS